MNNEITFNDQEVAIFSFLKSKGVSFKADYMGMKKDNDWQGDRFIVRFWRSGKSLSTEFTTGTGHRVGRKSGLTSKDKTELAKVEGSTFLVQENDWTKEDRKRNGNKEFAFGYRVYVATPSPASVIYSLMSDASFGEESHEDFCANMDYDTDSRKGLELYLACQKMGSELRSFFTSEEREELQTLLEDY